MKDRGLDRLFRERLQGYQKQPSPASWEKLEAKLKSQRKLAWWPLVRIAAAVALIACSVYIFSVWSNPGEHQPVAETQNQQSHETTGTSDVTPPPELVSESNHGTANNSTGQPSGEELPVREEATKPAVNTPKNSPVLDLVQSAQTKILADKALPQEEDITAEKSEEAITEPEAGHISEKESERPTEVTLKEESVKTKITITYKRSPAPPEPTLALVESSEEKTNKAKLIWQKAQELKNGELGGLAKIRAAKNQLLVFNKKNKGKELKSN